MTEKPIPSTRPGTVQIRDVLGNHRQGVTGLVNDRFRIDSSQSFEHGRVKGLEVFFLGGIIGSVLKKYGTAVSCYICDDKSNNMIQNQ